LALRDSAFHTNKNKAEADINDQQTLSHTRSHKGASPRGQLGESDARDHAVQSRARASSLGIKTGHSPPARHVSKHTTNSLASVAPMVPSIPVPDKNCKVDPSLHSFLSSYYPISHFATRPCILSQKIRSYSANVDSLTELLGRCTNAIIIAIQEV
jgi:hypothetical protein